MTARIAIDLTATVQAGTDALLADRAGVFAGLVNDETITAARRDAGTVVEATVLIIAREVLQALASEVSLHGVPGVDSPGHAEAVCNWLLDRAKDRSPR